MRSTIRLGALGALATVVATLISPSVLAGDGTETVTAGAYDRGMYIRNTYRDSHVAYLHEPDMTFFTTGREEPQGLTDPALDEIRTFFAFELPVVDAKVTKAALIVKFNGAAYASDDDSETFALYDVSSNLDVLLAGGDDTPGLGSVFDDLGSGHKYGSRTFTAADQGTIVRIPLDATAKLQARAGGKFTVGGALTTLSSRIDSVEQLFWFSSSDFVTLELTYAGSQPDGWIQSGSGVAGYGIFNATGDGQALTRRAAVGKVAAFKVTITNAAGLPDHYRLKAAGSGSGYTVRYLWAGKDITAKVVAGLYQTPLIDSAASADLTVRITVTSAAKAGSSLARAITIRSANDPSRLDVVKAIAKRR